MIARAMPRLPELNDEVAVPIIVWSLSFNRGAVTRGTLGSFGMKPVEGGEVGRLLLGGELA